jgi:hypothetical protein
MEVALRYTDGKVVDGQYGEQVMFSLTDDRVMYVEPIVAARIRSLGVQPGECFFILKTKVGRRNEWQVFREGDEPAAPAPMVERPTHKRTPAPHVLADRLPEIVAARNASNNLEQQLRDSITLVEAKRAASAAVPPPPPSKPVASAPAGDMRPQDRWKGILLAQTNALTDVLAEALKHGAEHGGLVKTDDVRSLLITAFIELSKRQERNRAA